MTGARLGQSWASAPGGSWPGIHTRDFSLGFSSAPLFVPGGRWRSTTERKGVEACLCEAQLFEGDPTGQVAVSPLVGVAFRGEAQP